VPPGDPVEGRRILVITEQGLDDCIMVAGYLLGRNRAAFPPSRRKAGICVAACGPPVCH